MLLAVGVAKATGIQTPYGAERLGSEDGSIPEWQGDTEDRTSFGPELLKEQPIYTIHEANLNEYGSELSAGLASLIQSYPDTMNVPVCLL